MTKAKKSRPRGRPPVPVSEKKTRNFTFRSRGNLHEKLSQSAESNERSISEEIEKRLEQSFADDEQGRRDNRLSQLLNRDHALNVLLRDGQGSDILDWIAFQMVQRPDWETTFDSRHAMANLISKKVLMNWPKPEGIEQ